MIPAYRVLSGGLIECAPSPIPEAEDVPDVGDLEPLTAEQQMRIRAVVAVLDRAASGEITEAVARNLARAAMYGEAPAHPHPESSVLCGTHSGYSLHYRHGTPRCDPCRAAHAAYMKTYMRAYRARRAGEGS